MNTAAIALGALSLAAAATAAAAAAPASDMDYVRANRCRGIAAGLDADASALNAYVKAQGGSRSPIVQSRADDEFARGKREARGDAKPRLSAELSGACAAYVGATPALNTMASR